MARHIPFSISKKCIDCGEDTKRDPHSWRCMGCMHSVKKFNTLFSAFLNKAIKAGEMLPAKEHVCVDCGDKAAHYDHRDYRKLTDVQPVCRVCNFRRGPAAWSAA